MRYGSSGGAKGSYHEAQLDSNLLVQIHLDWILVTNKAGISVKLLKICSCGCQVHINADPTGQIFFASILSVDGIMKGCN